MLFSVLIPVYNTAKYLDECIQSVLSQTEKDYELVLLDDGSTDDSGSICDDYVKKYPFIRVIHKQNEGRLLTRRRGFKEAKGEYCIWLDSDDYLCDNEAFAKIKRLILEQDCDLVIFNYLVEKETQDKNQYITLFDKPDGYVFEGSEKHILYKKFLADRDFNPIVNKVAKKAIVDIDVDYSEWNKSIYKGMGEDPFQVMPILNNATRIGYDKDILYFYRWNHESISRQKLVLEYYDAYKTLYQRQDYYIELWKVENEVIQKNKEMRINMIISIIIYCYNHLSDKAEKKKWMSFISSLSRDDFFIRLFDIDNKKHILLYYRLVGFFIRHRMKLSLQLCIKSVGFVSKMKH